MNSYILSNHELNLINVTLSSIADLTYQGIIILNDDGKTIYFNHAYCEFVSQPRHLIIGEFPVFLKENFSNPKCKMMIELSGGKNWISEYSFKNKSNSYIYLSSHIVPLISEDKINGYICYFTDITEKINIEKKLIENNRELITSITSLKYAQSNMIHHEKLAGIGQLSAGIAHELNNPLGFVKSNIDMLTIYVSKFIKLENMYESFIDNLSDNSSLSLDLKSELNDIKKFKVESNIDYLINDLHDLVEESAIGIDRASKIVDALRQFSGNNDNSPTELYNINEGIETTLLISKNYWKYDAKINKTFGLIPNIIANGNELNQVFLNLITNSVYAIKEKASIMPNFKGIIDISTYSDDSNVYIEFTDNGFGINSKDLSQIFNPFFTTKPVGKGTGLGLNISYNIIVNKHGGFISVDSDELSQTKFKISLPIVFKGGHYENSTY